MNPLPAGRSLATFAAAAALASGLLSYPTVAQATTSDCTQFADSLHQAVNPSRAANTGVQLLSLSGTEISNAAAHGFTQAGEDLGRASKTYTADSGQTAVHRLYKNGVFTSATTAADIASFTADGWVDQGTFAFAGRAASESCTLKAERFTKNGSYRTVTAADAKASLTADGWTAQEAGTFYLAATLVETAETTFNLAVIPDTQAETNEAANARFLGRTNWLAANKDALDLRYVLHTGDIVNWGWLDQPQYDRATAAMDKLTDASIPYNVSVGNHDTRAVGWNGVSGSTGYGGSAYMYNPECPSRLGAAECYSWLLVRHTEELNDNFPTSSIGGLGGTFESGKIDNNFSTFKAAGRKWLVLTLEFAPRTAAVNWAKSVVEAHPDYNVIVQTHYYIEGNGVISSSNAGYGSNSGSYVYNNLIKKYANIKLVFSGHTGSASSRVDTGSAGNKILTFLLNDLGKSYNSVRLVNIDTDAGTVSTKVYSPMNDKTWTSYATSADGMVWVS